MKSFTLTRGQFQALLSLGFILGGILLGLLALALRAPVGVAQPLLPTRVPSLPSVLSAATSIPSATQPTTAQVSPVTATATSSVASTNAPASPIGTPTLLPTSTPTATATPSQTPSPSPTLVLTPTLSAALPSGWPRSFPELTASKLSVHVVRNADPLVMQMVREAHPRLIKAVDDLGWLAEVKQVSPGTVTIGRFTNANSDFLNQWLVIKEPRAAAQEYVTRHLAAYRLNPAVDFWEGWNEFNAVADEDWRWFAEFEAERACLMQAHGLHAAVGTFPPGTPEYKHMALFAPALEAAHRCGGIFTLHEGVMPIIGCGVSATDPEVRIPGAPDFPGVAVGYMTARYRYWYEGYLKPRGLGNLPLVISELAVGGFVDGSPCNGPGGDDWKSYRRWWVQQGVAPTGEAAYLKVLAWYDQLMREDPYVLGATIFTAGAVNPDLGWLDFDVHEVLPLLTDYLLANR